MPIPRARANLRDASHVRNKYNILTHIHRTHTHLIYSGIRTPPPQLHAVAQGPGVRALNRPSAMGLASATTCSAFLVCLKNWVGFLVLLDQNA